MSTSTMNRTVAATAAALGSLAMLPTSDAATLYDIDFATLTEAPADWTPLINSAGWAVVDDIGYRYLRGTGAGADAVGLSSYSGTVIGDDAASGLDHYMVESNFTKTSTAGSNYTGVVARLQDASNYYMGVFDGAGTLRIGRVLGGTLSWLTSTTTPDTPETRYAANEPWRITFSVLGNALEAKVYNENDQLAGTASAIDASFSAGTFGARVNTSNNHYGAFQTLTVTGLEFEEPEPILTASPASGHLFDLGEFDLGESITLPGVIILSNDGTGTIQRTGFSMTGSGLFDIQGLIREGTTIGEGQSHNYDIAFGGSQVAGVYEAFATFQTTEGDVSYTLRATVVPEPASLTLLGLAGIGLMGRRMRRQG